MATTLDKRLEQAAPRAVPSKGRRMASGVYTLWLKHMKKFRRSVMEIGGTLFMPILWMLLFGLSMKGVVKDNPNLSLSTNYVAYMTPGILLLTSLTAAVLGGSTLLIERTSGVIKEYLIAPVPRLAVLLGTMASSLTKALLQSLLILVLGLLLGSGLHLNPLALLGGLVLVLVYSLGFVGIAAAAASTARGMESYHTLITILNLPVLFLSNALYPLDKAPAFVAVLAYLNPTTYAVDALRNLFYGINTEIGMWIDVPVLLAFMVLGVWFGLRTFQKAVANPA
ncbi:MAG TPA: ABC transporter permease [Chloroflexia bacterium]|nr:ABC transporter permease [Chloroflexia bacterium]